MIPYGSYLVEVLILWYFTARGLFSSFLLHSMCHQCTILLSQWWTWLEIKYSKCLFQSLSKWNKIDKNRFKTYSFCAKWFFSSALQNWPLQLQAEEAATCCTVIFSWRRRRGAVMFIRQLHCLGCCRPHGTSASADRIQVEKTSCPW